MKFYQSIGYIAIITANVLFTEAMAQLKPGDKAPGFTGKDQNGNVITLAEFRGKKVVLYFYPKDDTPGCTAEACNLRDNYSTLTQKQYVVIGVSPDNELSHQKFSGKYNLPFILIADTSHQILKLYNAWGEKVSYGKTGEGVLRKTYVIDGDGIIIKVIDKVETANHTQQILD